MKSYANPRDALLFIVIAASLMLVVHFVRNGGSMTGEQNRPPKNFETSLAYTPGSIPDDVQDDGVYERLEARLLDSFGPYGYEYSQPVDEVVTTATAPDGVEPDIVKPAKVAPEYAPIQASGNPKIAIIIDDVGVDRRRSFQTIDIDAPLTLAFLPYADGLDSITKAAQDAGHELMIHMPMQAMTNPVSLGPIALKAGMDEQTVKANMQAAFESFDGYVGLNNHMGSKVTQDSQIMDWVMETLKERDLYFVDSKTIGSSVGEKTARENGLATATRDVFLDHEATPSFVANALRKTERAAQKNGYAIAIGHPKDATINGLRNWIPDAEARGFEIVHASELVARPKDMKVAKSKVDKPSKTSKASGVKIAAYPEKIEKETKPDIADVEPAAGNTEPSKEEITWTSEIRAEASESLKGIYRDDPNSAQAREAILKRMLGQAE